MRKILAVTVLTFGLVAAVFGQTNEAKNVQAGTGVMAEVVYDSSKQINEAIYNKKNEISEVADEEVKEKVIAFLSDDVEDGKVKYTKELEEYFLQQIAEVENRPEFQQAEQQINSAAEGTVNRYKNEIDTLIAEILGF